MVQVHLKNDLSYEVGFLHWLGIHKSSKFIQSSQMDVVRYTHNDSKQRVSFIPRMNLYEVDFFCMYLGIHYYIYLIQSIRIVRHTGYRIELLQGRKFPGEKVSRGKTFAKVQE